MKIIIAPQAFKGTLSALQVADAMQEGIRRRYPNAEVVYAPIADGGDGTLDVLMRCHSGIYKKSPVLDPLNRRIHADWGYVPSTQMIIIEMAKVCGLLLLEPSQYNPMKTSTFGLGQMIHQILDLGMNHFFIGLGGSATQDGGTGMLQALGVRFLDQEGQGFPLGGGGLIKLKHIDTTYFDKRLDKVKFIVACDVNNRLLGLNGSVMTYGAQKGGTPEMIPILEDAMANYVQVTKRDLGIDIDVPFAGAAGGTASAFFGFLKGQLYSGVDLVLDVLEFDKLLEGGDLVLTGEGCLDRQTVFNKGPAGVAKRAKKYNIPVNAIVGKLGPGYEEVLAYGIDKVIPLVGDGTKETASKIIDAVMRL